jgi:hypothetical protein
MLTAYSFVRWSTKGQGKENTDSRIRQSKSAETWCRDNGYTLSEQVFIGDGESGFRGKHLKSKDGVAIGALARFIHAIETETIPKGILCIDSVDRFSRQEIWDALDPFNKILKLGVGIVFTGSPMAKLLTRELINKEPIWLQYLIQDMVRSWMESSEKSRKVKDAKQRKRQRVVNGEVLNYGNVVKHITWDEKSKSYKLNDNAVIVQRMAKEFLAGESLYAITKKLNEEGIGTFQYGKQWSPTCGRRILTNTTLVGEFLGNKNFCPPILSKEDFERIGQLLNKSISPNVSGRTGKITNIFRGMSFCSACKSPMNVTTQRKDYSTGKMYKRVYRYWRCSAHASGKRCSNRSTMDVDIVEQEFFVNFLMKTPEELNSSNDEGVKTIQRSINTEQTKKTQLEKQIANLTEAVKELGFAQFKDELSKIQKQLSKVTDELNRLSTELRMKKGAPLDFKNIRELIATDDMAHTEVSISIAKALKNEDTRKQLARVIPSIIGKIVCETETPSEEGVFNVYDRSEKLIYRSLDV